MKVDGQRGSHPARRRGGQASKAGGGAPEDRAHSSPFGGRRAQKGGQLVSPSSGALLRLSVGRAPRTGQSRGRPCSARR